MRPALLVSLVLLALLAFSAGAAPARAEPPRHAFRLVYVRGSGTATCPDEATLRKELGGVLHYDPVQPDAPRRLTAIIERHEGELTAIAIMRDEKGHVLWETDQIPTTSSCRVLVGSLALAIDAWLGRAKAEPEPEPAKPPEPPKVAPPVAIPPPPEPPRPQAPVPRNVSGYVGVDALGSFAVTQTPSIGAGFVAGVRLRDPALFFEVGGRATGTVVATDLLLRNGTRLPVRSSFLAATLSVCGSLHRFVFACGLAGAGTVAFRAGGTLVTSARYGFGVLGVRGGFEDDVAKLLKLRVFGELAGLPTSANLNISDAQVWSKPSVMGAVGVGLVWSPW